MAATKVKSQKLKTPKSRTSITSSKVQNAYKEFVLIHNTEPASMFAFAKEIKVDESEIYKHFSTFSAIKKDIWQGYFNQTNKALQKDASYGVYSSREKMLAFYYTLIEVLKTDRSFVSLSFQNRNHVDIVSPFLKKFKDSFSEFALDLVEQGIENKEIVKRPIVSKRYHDGLWLQLMFVINFWITDDSDQFEKTDAAIEKAVNLSFELMGNGPLDMMVDFAKFLFQNKR